MPNRPDSPKSLATPCIYWAHGEGWQPRFPTPQARRIPHHFQHHEQENRGTMGEPLAPKCPSLLGFSQVLGGDAPS